MTKSTSVGRAARVAGAGRLVEAFVQPPHETDSAVLATADCDYPPLVVADLNDVISKTPANINVLLGRLVESGVLYRIRKGQYEYTAPKLRDFLLRRTGKG